MSDTNPKLTSNVDQFDAVVAGLGDTYARMYRKMVAGKLPRHLAAKVIEATATEVARGLFDTGKDRT